MPFRDASLARDAWFANIIAVLPLCRDCTPEARATSLGRNWQFERRTDTRFPQPAPAAAARSVTKPDPAASREAVQVG
jgi:hypothetical protein